MDHLVCMSNMLASSIIMIFVCGKINMVWYFSSIYDVYFDEYYIDDGIINNDSNYSDNIIDDVLFYKIEVE